MNNIMTYTPGAGQRQLSKQLYEEPLPLQATTVESCNGYACNNIRREELCFLRGP
jgi:hypothetical protein